MSTRAYAANTATDAGTEVQSRYDHYLLRFQKTYNQLREVLQKEAPQLLPRLARQAPQPVPYGYQILPPLTAGAKTATYNEDLLSRYSWPITAKYIQWEESMLTDIDEKLSFLGKMKGSDRRAILGQIVTDLPRMEKNQQLIDHHIQHNRFWQKAIAEDRSRFDAITVLAKAAEELQQIRRKSTTPQERLLLTSREQELLALIHNQTSALVGKPIFKIKTAPPTKNQIRKITIEMPVGTDIQNKAFLNRFKNIVERTWKLTSDQTLYSVKVKFKPITSAVLYHHRNVPKQGQHIDVVSHLKLFSQQEAVLTTGSNSTYALPSRAIVLGPHGIYEQTLAHEFGHILGFVDTYFRGYKDLGKDGFEIIEVVPDAQDIMSMPDAGKVQLHHFETLLRAASAAASNPPSIQSPAALPPPASVHTTKSADPGTVVK